MSKNNIFSKKQVNLTKEFFPSLNMVEQVHMVEQVQQNNSGSNDILKKNISYADKLNCAVKEELIAEVEPGSVIISIDKNNKIHYKYGKSTLKEKNTLSEMEEFKNNIQEMLERWENYKNSFIDLNGEDEYNKHYRCPNYNYEYLNENEDEEEYLDEEIIVEEEEVYN